MLVKRAKKFTNVVIINVFEIQREAVAVVAIKHYRSNQTLSKQSKIKNFAPVKNLLIA